MLFVPARGPAELSRDPAGRENVLGLCRRKCYSTPRIPGQGAGPYLLFFATRGSCELWPGTETDATSHTFPAADNPGHPAAVDASATDLEGHAYALADGETVRALRG